MRATTLSAAALAALPAVYATELGSAVVVNNCDAEVNLWYAYKGSNANEVAITLNPNGGKWSQTYFSVDPQDGLSSGGISIKLTTDTTCNSVPITQFEYTYNNGTEEELSGQDPLWYDISNVDCKGSECPFYTNGFYLDAPTVVDCGPLTSVCDAVYNVWNDDLATHSSDDPAKDLTLYLCGKDGSSSITASASSAAYTSVAVSTYSTPTSSYVASTTPVHTPTTFSTVTPAPTPSAVVMAENFVQEAGNVVMETEVITEYATAVYTEWAKRSPEPQAHAANHKREHGHHHAHPHWRK